MKCKGTISRLNLQFFDCGGKLVPILGLFFVILASLSSLESANAVSLFRNSCKTVLAAKSSVRSWFSRNSVMGNKKASEVLES